MASSGSTFQGRRRAISTGNGVVAESDVSSETDGDLSPEFRELEKSKASCEVCATIQLIIEQNFAARRYHMYYWH